MLTLKCVCMCLFAKSRRGASCGGPCLSLIPALGRGRRDKRISVSSRAVLVYILSSAIQSKITLSQKKKKGKSGIDKQKDFDAVL